MKALIIYFLIFILNNTIIYSQNKDFVNFINSFKKFDSNKIYNAGELININNKMTKKEAISFVYFGDSSKLYCKYKIYSLETEKIKGTYSELVLPNKCILLDMNSYYLIGFTSNEYQDSEKIPLVMLILYIIDKNYNIRDTIIVYKGNEYEETISSLINSNNVKIFLLSYNQNLKSRQAYIYKINNETLKFELIKEKNNVIGNTDNLIKLLEFLEWDTIFMN